MIERLLAAADGKLIPVGYVISILLAIIMGIMFSGPWYQKLALAFVVWWGGVMTVIIWYRRKSKHD